MKNYSLLFIIFLLFQVMYAQSESSLITKTLQNYMNGSSYNELEMLESAFADNATLYLTTRDGFKMYTPKEYAGFFKKGEKRKIQWTLCKNFRD